MIDEDALKIDDFSVIGPREEDAASLPSFKPLAEHRRANSTPKPPARAQRERITSPPLDLPLLLIPEPVAPPRVPCLHWRILRALALLLIGSGIGAALVYAASESGHQPKTEAKYYTVLPFAVPAAPPQEILYLDKWRIVAIDPSSLAESVKAEQAAKVEPPRAVEMLAPAMPIAPPPQIIIVERGSTKHPKIKHRVAEMHPPPLPRLGVPVVAEPKKSEDDGDVAEQIRRWLSGAN